MAKNVDDAMTESVSAAVREAWRAAITLANNICVQESDRHNDNDEIEGANTGSACAKRIREYVDIADEHLIELLTEAGAIAALSVPAHGGEAEMFVLHGYGDNALDNNGCHQQAIRALTYLAEHGKVAQGGEQFPNSECCMQIASELEQSFLALQRMMAAPTTERAQGVEGLRQGNWARPGGGRIVGWVIEPDDAERMKADAFCLPREVAEALEMLRASHTPPAAAPLPTTEGGNRQGLLDGSDSRAVGEDEDKYPKPGSRVWQLSSRIGDLTAENTGLRARIAELITPATGLAGGDGELPEFLEWVAAELVRRDTASGTFASGVADSLRGRATVLRIVSRERRQGDEGASHGQR